MSANWTAIIMAAGAGTRMRSSLPKVAHPVAGRPIVRHVIEAARAARVSDIVVVVGSSRDAEAVRTACGEDVRFVVQPEQIGTGHAVACARDAASAADHILILNGDVPLVRATTLQRLMAAVGDDTSASLSVLAAHVPVESYGFLELDGDRIVRIIETKESEGIDRTEARPINSGQYAVRASWLWPHLERITPAANGERYLTALAAMAHDEASPGVVVFAEEPVEVRGINDRIQLAEAEAAMRQRILRGHMAAGVTIIDPAATYIDADVTIGPDTVIEPHTHLRAATSIGADCRIGPEADVRGSILGDRCIVFRSTVEEATMEADVEIGPYSHLRPGAYLGSHVHLGNYAEVNRSRLGRGTKMGHFSYVGDADVGENVNIGAGTITANYDGTNKNRTTIGDGAFIGSDTILIAPVNIGRGSRTAAGSVVNKDVPDGMIAIGSPARIRAIADSKEDDAGR